MFLESLMPQLPDTIRDAIPYIVGILGTILVIYSQFVEAENRRDIIRMTGAAGVFFYAYTIVNLLFLTLSGGIFLAALVEYIEIIRGTHIHLQRPPTQ